MVIFIHEFGHYYVGKRCGIGVKEFSIGFGPKLLGLEINLEFFGKFNILPFGGFVKFEGDLDLARCLLKLIILQKIVIILIMHQ